MIDQQELPSFVGKNIPELSVVCKKEKEGEVYNIIRHLFTYTAAQMAKHNLTAAKRCMSLAVELYYKGNTAIKNAIENVYIFSFSHAFFYDENKRKEIMKIVPVSLYELYKKQVINSHL